MQAVGYIRVSKVGGREGDSFISPALQREQIDLAARREDLDVVEVIEELDASGGDASRPGWNRAIGLVESGEVGAIVVWNLSRFSRSVKDALDALDRIRVAGGRLVSATEPIADDPEGELSMGMVLQFAQYERSRARRQFRAATASAVGRGIHVAGTVPLGYMRGPDRRLVPDPETAPIVNGLFERRAKGWSWVKLARWATEQLAPLTPHGEEPRVLADNTVAGMIRNPAYLGQARYGDVTRDDAHEAIVPRGLWRKCQAKAKPSARTGKLTERFLLQGLATCASCGRAMYLSGSGKRNRSPYYMCRQPRCREHAYAQAQALDAFVLNRIEERMTGIDYDGVRVSEGLGEEGRRYMGRQTRRRRPRGRGGRGRAGRGTGRPRRLPIGHHPSAHARRGAVQRGRRQPRCCRQQVRERPGRGSRAERRQLGAGRPPLAH